MLNVTYAKCRYTECRYAECRGAIKNLWLQMIFFGIDGSLTLMTSRAVSDWHHRKVIELDRAASQKITVSTDLSRLLRFVIYVQGTPTEG